MRLQPLLASLGCAILLAACASEGIKVPSATPVKTLAHVMGQAEEASKAGHADQALQFWKEAAGSFPADKTPWLHIAQMKFDRNQYGDAIGNALEVLQRDPDDKSANGIVAISGLRLSAKALTDLGRQNNLSPALRSESQDLSRQVRASLVEEVAAPAPVAVKRPQPGKKGAAAVAGAAKGAAAAPAPAADPFSGLK